MIHSPADVVAVLLVNLNLATDPASADAWPAHVTDEPNVPDNCITTFDTEGVQQGRFQQTGEMSERYGVQVRIRSQNHRIGWAKASAIRDALDLNVLRRTVTYEGSTYCVQSIRRPSTIITLGKEIGASKRRLYTINCLAIIHQI